MEKKYIILSRYEIRKFDGIEFCPWFVYKSDPLSESEANEIIKNTKKDFGFIDKKTHLKHEYMLKEYDEFVKEQKDKQNNIKKLVKKNEAYYKSDQYKELQRKKRISTKERKENLKKYLANNA